MKKTAVLAIDLQNDFTLPEGTLSVHGADQDVIRIADFIYKNQQKIHYIALTLDSHQPIHIAHQNYWQDENGNHPAVFSHISALDVKDGRWNPLYNKDLALIYLEQLETKGEVCTIWPEHCILGTTGWALDKVITDTLSNWAVTNARAYELFYKGFSQTTEHYSIFKAAVEWETEPETYLNTRLLNKLNEFDEVILIGEAADYCVASSLSDIVESSPELASKIVVLTDCMSWIEPDNKKAVDIFNNAEKQGVRFVPAVDYAL